VSLSVLNFALELTMRDQPGLFSDISATLLGLGFNVSSATAWTHNERVACIIHLEDANELGPIHDAESLAHVQDELQKAIKARDGEEERKRVRLRLRSFAAGRNHTERRLHQMMYADGDYERCGAWQDEKEKNGCEGIEVSVGRYAEKGYWVVNVRSRDRPKLLFDTVCVLTDMQYEVFHAAITSNTSMADQVLLYLLDKTCIHSHTFLFDTWKRCIYISLLEAIMLCLKELSIIHIIYTALK